MKFINKYSSTVLILAGLVVLYFITRIYNLSSLPIFTDEAIYIRWSQIANADASWRFISLTDGKQPLYVWIAMTLLEFIKDPLVAGRMVSVLAGFGSLIGIFFTGKELFKDTKIGLLSAFLYVIYPFSLLYDRMALYDSLVAMFIIWSIYFTILLVRYMRLDIALIFGMIVGGGLLTKTSNYFAFILLPVALLLFPFKKKFDKVLLGKFILLSIVAFVIANVISFVMRLSPYYHIIGQKNLTFVYSFSEWIQSPFAHVVGNLKGMGGWLFDYMTIPFLLVTLAAFFITKKYLREKLFLLAWFILPLIALAFFGKVIYPRYLLFMTMPLLILGAFSLNSLLFISKKVWLKVLILIAFTVSFFITDYYILTNVAKAHIASGDRDQLINGWPAGKGVKETVAYLENEAKDKKIFVGTQGTFGLMPYSLEMYLSQNPNITLKGYWPIDQQPPEEVLTAAKSMPVYVVFYQPCGPCEGVGLAPTSWNLEKIMQFEKGKGIYYTVYRLKSQ